MVIHSLEQIKNLKSQLYLSAEQAILKIRLCEEQNSALGLLAHMKFGELGVHPLDGRDLNLIEQLNQLFSNLVVIEAADYLLHLYPEKSFVLHLGTESGFDIESSDGEIAAECFAVTRVSSNRKLIKDAEKLLKNADGKKKYIFFYSHTDSAETVEKSYIKFPDITFHRIMNLVP